MDIRLDRVGGLIDQFDSTLDFANDRFVGLTDGEWLWSPADPARTWTVARRGEAITAKAYGPGEWVLDHDGGDTIAARSIAWLISHLTGGLAGRWEYTFGARAADDQLMVDFTPHAGEGLELFGSWCDKWREGLETLTDEQLNVPGYGQYPGGLDPELPFYGIVWWVNRELIHHLAEAMALRDLYALRA